jgi:ATP/maltotriose-dependent transcriptional regulator MalT
VLFDAVGTTESEAAALLVRGALASGNLARAARLTRATEDLAQAKPGDCDLAAAAAHVRGLMEHDSAALEQAASTYSAPLAKATAIEDAGRASSAQGDQNHGVARLRRAYEQYEKMGRTEEMARVRSQLRVAGVRVRHWKGAGRPAFGWGSLTETERRIAELVSQGLSNHEVASQVFLSAHTVAFHATSSGSSMSPPVCNWPRWLLRRRWPSQRLSVQP